LAIDAVNISLLAIAAADRLPTPGINQAGEGGGDGGEGDSSSKPKVEAKPLNPTGSPLSMTGPRARACVRAQPLLYRPVDRLRRDRRSSGSPLVGPSTTIGNAFAGKRQRAKRPPL